LLPLDEAVVDATATKQFVDIAASTADHVDVRYRVVAGVASAPASGTTRVRFDAIEDVLRGGGVLQSATVTDAIGTRTIATTAVARTEQEVEGVTEVVHRFIGPFEATRTTSARTDVTLTYVMRLARPESGSVEYVNFAWALSGDQVIGSGAVVTGIPVSVPDEGDPTVGDPVTRESDRRAQRITFDSIGPFGAGTSTRLNATTDSGLPVSFTVTAGTDRCTVSQFDGVWTLQTLSSGNCTVTASADGDETFAAATPVHRDVVVLAGQFITSGGATFAGGVSSAEITLNATSKLAVGLRSLDTDVCTTSGTPTSYDASTGATIHTVARGTAAGACRLVATQSGDGTAWGPAPELEVMIGVGEPQVLSISAPASGTEVTLATSGSTFVPQTANVVGTTDANATLTGSKKLPLQFRTLTPAVCRVTQPSSTANGELLSGLDTTTGNTTWTYTLVAPGTCTIAADQDGLDDDGIPSAFAPTGPITRSITVRSVATTPQYLFLSARSSLVYGDVETFTVTASSREADDPASAVTGLPVLLAGTAGVCTVGAAVTTDGITTATVRVIGGGTCTVHAEQAGDTVYAAATPISRGVTVNARTIEVVGLSTVDRLYDGTATVTLTGAPALSGVVPGDGPQDVALTGTPTASVTGPSAGSGRTATVAGLSLTGAKAADSYVLAERTLSVTITQRPVDVDGLSVTSRAYDGTTDITVTGTPALRTAAQSGAGRGRLAGDDVSVAGTPTGALDVPDAGTSVVAVGGLTLGGAAAANYTLAIVELEAVITARQVTVTALDRSVRTGRSATCSVVVDDLAIGDTLSAVDCAYLDDAGDERDPDVDEVGNTFRIVPSSPQFTRAGEAVTPDNYAVQMVEGWLTITGRTVADVTFNAERDVTIVYGTALSDLLDAEANAGGAPVDGTFEHRTQDGTELIETTTLDVGTYVVVVTFTPDDDEFEQVTETRTITVLRRSVTVAGVTATSRSYDATRDVEVVVSGAVLEPSAPGGTTGILSADAAGVALGGVPTGTVGTANVGEDRIVTVAGLTLVGGRAGNYELAAVEGVTADITPRPLTLRAVDATIAPGETPPCSVTKDVGAGVGLAGPDAVDAVTCVSLTSVGGSAADLSTEGSAVLVPSTVSLNPGSLANYTLTVVEATVTVVRLAPALPDDAITFTYGGGLTGRFDVVATSPRGGSVAGTLRHQWLLDDGALVDVDESELLNAGARTLVTTFMPGNSGRYRTVGTQRVVTVAQRPVTVTPLTRFKLAGTPDPTLTVELDGLLAADEDVTLDVPLVVDRDAGEQVGQYAIASSGGGHRNYAFQHRPGVLFIGAITVDVPVTGIIDRDDTLTCDCEGFVPGTVVTVELFSDPVLLGTDTVGEDGTCPLLAALTLPGSDVLPDGDHALVVTVTEEEGSGTLDGQPIVLSAPVTVDGGVVGSRGIVAPPDPPQTGDTTPPFVGPTPSPDFDWFVSGPDSLSLVTGPLAPAAPRSTTVPASPTAPVSPRAPATPPFGGSGIGAGSGPNGRVTFDLGPGGSTVALRPDASLAEILAVTRNAVTMPIDALAEESFGGFAPSSGVSVEVIGARTGARFILTDVGALDAFVLSRAIPRSAASHGTDFARIAGIRPVAVPPASALPLWSSEQRGDAADQFAASRLKNPVFVTELDLSGVTTWLEITGEVAGYLPGSTVHLAVTSRPVVLASVVVGQDGTAVVSGLLPVDALTIGEHRIRIVGTRAFDGVTVDADGEIRLDPSVLAEIERFDRGTDAAVIVRGLNGEGGEHVSLRIVPLDLLPPWWTLLVVIAVGFSAVRLRRLGQLTSTSWRAVAITGVIASAGPAVVLGWVAGTLVVAEVGLIVAAVLAVVVLLVRTRTDEPTVDAERDLAAAQV
jgi:hypothetical protein